MIDGKKVERDIKEEKVINVATIHGVFGNRFQTTGLSMSEARELALLLRGGALAAPISIVNERVDRPAARRRRTSRRACSALVIGMARAVRCS